MCRSTDFQRFYFKSDQNCLKIKSFFIRLSNLQAGFKKLPESLTLVYLPRISETGLKVSGKEIQPDSPAFVTLYRAITAKTEDGASVYGSRERVTASDGGVMFEVYSRDEKVLKGILRKDEKGEWKLECKCTLERERGGGDDVARAEVCVEAEGHVAMVDKLDMVGKRKRRNCRRRMFGNGLEDIPEERETDNESQYGITPSDACCCCSCGEVENGTDGDDLAELDAEMESVRWAVDVGIWVVCLGVGYLFSKASAKSLLRGKRIS